MSLILVGLIFWLSGLAGLVYEVVWFRQLATTFGATGPAIAATTGSFMAGLGLGSWIVSRYADRVRHPVRWYAVLELMLAAYAASMGSWIQRIEGIHQWAAVQGYSGSVMAFGQFTMIFVVLIIPTGLMGATLPLMCRALVLRNSHLGRRFAWLYGVNTLGAAVGAAMAGFVLIQEYGLATTSGIAVGLNVVAAISALLISGSMSTRSHESTNQVEHGITSSPSVEPAVSTGTIRLGVFACGFAGLAAQNLWVRSLLFGFDRLKNTTYSFSAVLTVTLLGLVMGTAVGYSLVDRLRRPQRALAAVVAGVGLSILISVCVLMMSPKIMDTVDPRTLQVDFAKAVSLVVLRTAAVVGLPCVLLGLATPIAVRCVGNPQSIGREVGRLYACNTLGAVVGALAAAFVLPPFLGLLPSLLWIGASMLVVAAVMQPRSLMIARTYSAIAALTALIAVFAPTEFWWLQSLRAGEEIIALHDGVTGTVCVIENSAGERRICVDDVPVAGTSSIMQTDQKCLAHWSMLIADEPKSALTVGFGSGGASYSFLLHDQLEKLDCVEISPDVPRMAPLLRDANHGLLDNPDPRYRIIYADARAYLARATERYDIIVSDCTDLRYRSSANLYDLEYFQLCRDGMTDDGCTTIWMPLGGLSTAAFRMTLNTFDTVFPNVTIYYLHNRWTHYVLLVGRNVAPRLSVSRVRRQLSEVDVRGDMAEIGMTDPYKVIATFLTSGTRLQGAIRSLPLNTEDMPRLEFDVPRFDMGPWSAQQNLNFLRLSRAPMSDVLSPETTEQELAAVGRYQQAAEFIMAAQASARAFNFEDATYRYLAAQRLTPEDSALEDALQFRNLLALAEEGQPTAILLYGRTRQLQGDAEGALEAMDRFQERLGALAGADGPEKQQWYQQGLLWEATAGQWKNEFVTQRSSQE
jgi:spermidine synthase